MDHESVARSIHNAGHSSCSVAVDRAFADVNEAAGNPPQPRSIQGKCGALLAAEKVLVDLGAGHVDDLERAFADELGHLTCRELRRHRVNCNDCVGVAARLTDQLLAKQQ